MGISTDTTWDDALVDLYVTEFDSLQRSAKRLVGSFAVAEEIVQEAFIRYQLSPGRPAEGKEVAYLRSIVMNGARTALRKRATGERHRTGRRCSAASSEAEWFGAAYLDDVVKAILDLPVRQREVFTQRVLLDRSERQTAASLSISTGAVKTHLSRARRNVAAAIECHAVAIAV